MKLLVIFGLVVAVAAEPLLDYHENFGIPQAARIKQAESAQDFDGARIIGGQVTPLGAQPHLGGLIIDLVDGRQSMCGSTLLSNTRVLTAAHCWRTSTLQGRQMTVVLGSTNLFSGGVRSVTSDVEVHSAYNANNLNNDIAIVRIPHTPFTNVVLRALLPEGSQTYVGVWAVAAGFGATADSSQNQVARHVNLQVVPNSACLDMYGPNYIRNTTLCAATTGGTSPCSGDTGGPLVIGPIANREVIGVLSFLPLAGCTSALPVGYTRVTSYASWISARL